MLLGAGAAVLVLSGIRATAWLVGPAFLALIVVIALYPILAAMTVWGEQWAPHPAGPRMTLVERDTGLPVAGVGIRAADGRDLAPAQIDTVAGPGADDKTHALMRMREETSKQ